MRINGLRDDAVGIQVVRNLKSKVSKAVFLIEGETVPESFIGPITEFNPTHILIVDAGLLNLKPGALKLVDPAQLSKRTAISTHTLPLAIFCEYLARTTKAKMGLLVIQPGDTSFGESLSPALEQTATQLGALLSRLLPTDKGAEVHS